MAQRSSKVLKAQQALAWITLVLALVLIGVGIQEGGEKHPATVNGITTLGLAIAWLIAVRLAGWWHHA